MPAHFAVLPDSADSRLLRDLTSHANDLSEAAHALQGALNVGVDSDLWEFLTSHAVTAYVRPFIHSNVRTRLDKMPEVAPVPSELQAVHDIVRKYRNTTVAHSQADLVMPLPVAVLDDSGYGIDVMGVAFVQTIPLSFAQAFAALINAMEEVVDQATQPVLERLRTSLKLEAPESIASWPQPEVSIVWNADFSAGGRRKDAPRLTFYGKVEPISTEIVPEGDGVDGHQS
ncbi:hypothetical protein [Arthrobacter sp. 260]|uniref:hypothetical protein n=1 Tax=Arthrobacter sp. 260 TaxID=2735314 RepID=UPI001490A3E5|nr:hypothetical protein [Arthrobacter sp. 260]